MRQVRLMMFNGRACSISISNPLQAFPRISQRTNGLNRVLGAQASPPARRRTCRYLGCAASIRSKCSNPKSHLSACCTGKQERMADFGKSALGGSQRHPRFAWPLLSTACKQPFREMLSKCPPSGIAVWRAVDPAFH